jgi:hypothetical protein
MRRAGAEPIARREAGPWPRDSRRDQYSVIGYRSRSSDTSYGDRSVVLPPRAHRTYRKRCIRKGDLRQYPFSWDGPCDRPGPLVHIATSTAWLAHAGRNLVQRLKHLPSLPQGARAVRIYSTARAETCLTFRLHGSRPTPERTRGTNVHARRMHARILSARRPAAGTLSLSAALALRR